MSNEELKQNMQAVLNIYSNMPKPPSREELHRLLPSPLIKDADFYYQSMVDVSTSIKNDKLFNNRIKYNVRMEVGE